MKYKIADGTTIEANGYIVFYQDANFGEGAAAPGSQVPFALSENGETLYLRSGLDQYDNWTGYFEDEDFGAAESDVAFGRYYKASTDNFNFVAMSANTPDAVNAYPKVGPIVINEIYHTPFI